MIVALLKGPGMIFLGTIYAFLVGLFPPIGIVLSAIFFLLNLGTLAKNWRLSLTGFFFYGYPIAAMFLRVWRNWDNIWFLTGSLAIGLLVLHLLLTKIYQRYGIGRTIFWYLFSLPFVFLTALLPKRLKRRIKLLPKSWSITILKSEIRKIGKIILRIPDLFFCAFFSHEITKIDCFIHLG